MKVNALLAVAALATTAIITTDALAQAKPETLVKQRQAAMTLQGKYFYASLRPMAAATTRSSTFPPSSAQGWSR